MSRKQHKGGGPTCSPLAQFDKRERDEFQRRLFRRIDTSAGLWGCWEWQGHVTNYGYGIVVFPRPATTSVSVHRAVYELYHGPIPDGMVVCHACDNRRCCNPAHLWLGTQADNIHDMIAKGRNQHGEEHHSAKLTEDDVREVRAMLSRGADGGGIGRQFGVSRQTINLIKRQQIWGWLPDEPNTSELPQAA